VSLIYLDNIIPHANASTPYRVSIIGRHQACSYGYGLVRDGCRGSPWGLPSRFPDQMPGAEDYRRCIGKCGSGIRHCRGCVPNSCVANPTGRALMRRAENVLKPRMISDEPCLVGACFVGAGFKPAPTGPPLIPPHAGGKLVSLPVYGEGWGRGYEPHWLRESLRTTLVSDICFEPN
jgi:hypothetical protein